MEFFQNIWNAILGFFQMVGDWFMGIFATVGAFFTPDDTGASAFTDFLLSVVAFMTTNVPLFGIDFPMWSFFAAGGGLLVIVLVIVICACAAASKKKKAAKAKAEDEEAVEAIETEEEVVEAIEIVEEEPVVAVETKNEEPVEAVEEVAETEEVVEEPAQAPIEEVADEAQEEVAEDVAEEEAVAQEPTEAVAEDVAEEVAQEETVEKSVKDEEEAARKAEEEAAKKAAAAEKRKKAAEARKAKKAAEEEAARKAAEEEARKAEEAAAKKAAAAEKRKQAAAERKAKQAAEAAATAAVAESAAKKEPVAETPAVKAPRYSGKWIVTKATVENEDGEHYFFELRASNGQKLLTSWEYNSYQGALRGIDTYKANIEKGNFRVYQTKKGEFFFKLLTGKNTLLGTGANYPTKEGCEKTIESVKRFAPTAIVDEKLEEIVYKANEENDFTETVEQVDEGYVGKWIINLTKGEDEKEIYTFELYANNGQLLLSSEEYSSFVGVINGISTHKANIQKGNFSIQMTKKKEWFFLLLNGNKQPLCLGEHYKAKARCESAVESVKRFAPNAPIFFNGKEIK